MNSRLMKFLKENGIEMHVDTDENENEDIIAFIPFDVLQEFIDSCQNDECHFIFDDDEAYQAYLRSTYLCVYLGIIIEYLEEDIKDYFELCSD